MSPTDAYREVFKSEAGQLVLADLSAWVDRRAEAERVGGYAVLSRILKMTALPRVPAKPRVIRAAGGRIAHGA